MAWSAIHRSHKWFESLTSEWLTLPEVFFDEGAFTTGTNGFALLYDPVDVDDQIRYRYKVVIINDCIFVPNYYRCFAAIFDSETMQFGSAAL